ncbi:ferredoxin--NADP reductase [Cytophagaceae bacterium DM2B3-1]|uniref:Ferredoxin--NADP reductase n=1 Tax=Xanthocytophaga flava TaxID=3048013 RepID=A0ABT7CGE3_9BACT|nr:ferredoxin--NADP reductase [Xanthocytophaga flavus]MDJ1472022.1 ferredoxin--NADP reductase [Xanthocytophaga flavus]MDJ1492806.1 ferredoxin--NADP reductase [Xanthocytophaga flavus]
MNDFLSLRIKAIRLETADTKTFIFETLDQTPVAYQAGQFLTFLIQHNGHEVRRSYSLSSSPDVDEPLTVTIKRVVNGEISRYILDTWKVGDIIQSLYPAGRFTIKPEENHSRDIILIGAGSGITPLYSLIKTIQIREPHSRITLIYANHNATSTIFRDELEKIALSTAKQLRCIHIWALPEEGKIVNLASNAIQYIKGRRLNNALLEKLIQENVTGDLDKALFYLCGPVPVMRMAHITLRFMGYGVHQIRQEHFVITPLTTREDNVVTVSGAPASVKIKYRSKDFALLVPLEENILQAALKQGIQLPYSCRGGRCSTCVARCLKGKVHMSINEVLTDQDMEEGWVLTCTGYPETDEVELSFE